MGLERARHGYVFDVAQGKVIDVLLTILAYVIYRRIRIPDAELYVRLELSAATPVPSSDSELENESHEDDPSVHGEANANVETQQSTHPNGYQSQVKRLVTFE